MAGASLRAAEPGDAERCAALSAAAVDELRTLRGGPLYARREAKLLLAAAVRPGGLRRLLDDPARRVVVAAADGDLVGLAVGHVEEIDSVALGVLDAYYVVPASRRLGLGTRLVADLVTWLDSRGCRAIDAPALPGSRAMKNLLEQAGFKARLLTMHRLGDDDDDETAP